MNLLTIGIELDEVQAQRVTDLGFQSTSHVKKLPIRATKKTYALVLFYPSTLPTPKDLKKYAELFPKAWRVLIAKNAWLKKTDKSEALQVGPFHDLWLKETLNYFFETGLRRFRAQLELHEEIHKHKSTIKDLKSECEQLSHRSSKLVEQLKRDVSLATSLQRSLLPSQPPKIPGIQIQTKFVPASGGGGDYFDVFEFGDKKRFGILLADSKTHGMAASLLSVLIKLRLDAMKEQFSDSKSFVAYLNDEIQRIHTKDIAKLSLMYGILDRSTLTFQYTVAGHLQPLLWRLGEAPPLTTPTNPPLGGLNDYSFKEGFLTLKPADLLLFFTDGLEAPMTELPDLEDKSVTLSAHDKFIELLQNKQGVPDPLDLQNDIMALVDRHVEESKLTDDFTLLQFCIEENAMYLTSNS